MVVTIGAGARGKGASGEREVKIILRSILQPVYLHHNVALPEFERNLEQSRDGGYDLKGLEWLAIEVKRQERSNLTAWWEQTLKQCGENQIPLLLHRANHQPWRARLRVPVVITGWDDAVLLTVDMERHDFDYWLQYEAYSRLSQMLKDRKKVEQADAGEEDRFSIY